MKNSMFIVKPFQALFSALWLLIILGACNQSPTGISKTEVSLESTKTPKIQSSFQASQSTSKPTNTPEPVSTLGVEASELRGIIIHFWHIWSSQAGEVIKDLVDEFNLNNSWGIVVVPHQSSLDEIYANVSVAVNAGDSPDLVVAYLHQALPLSESGDLVDLEMYVDDPIWGYTQDEQADFYKVFWEQNVVRGERLGMAVQPSAQVLYYNQTWAKELGFSSPPSTFEQFKAQACAAGRANRQDATLENDGTGGWIISTNHAAILSWLYSSGGKIFSTEESDAENGAYNFATPQVEEVFSFLRGLYDSGCAWLAENQYPEVEFASRLGLFATGSMMSIPYQADAFNQINNADQWVIIPYPSSTSSSAISTYSPSLFMFSTSPRRQLASWEFTKWLLSPYNHARLIQAMSIFPVRASSLDHLDLFRSSYPQWQAAVDLLSTARSEPPFKSWGTVRWAISDAATQLFRSYFTFEQIPTLVVYLDRTAAELHGGAGEGQAVLTPVLVITPTP